jgi:hypothetical protein
VGTALGWPPDESPAAFDFEFIRAYHQLNAGTELGPGFFCGSVTRVLSP